jgi:iron complex outermembrane receptor protein
MPRVKFTRRTGWTLCAWSLLLGTASAAYAQSAAADDSGAGDIIVTARKRQESILNVPVVEQAIAQVKLERLAVQDVSDLPALVPGLHLEKTFLSIGTLVSIRGIGTDSEDPGVQQSVGLNIDGMALSSGLAFQTGLFDLQQVEVLKGPQNLFYGKSSPAGVISLRTADPTDKKELIARMGYETESVQPRAELILSGPVTDTLKMRLAGTVFTQRGYFRYVGTVKPGTGAIPLDPHRPDEESHIVRLTTLWAPTSDFSARLKVNYSHDNENGSDVRQCAAAPGGTAPIPPFNDYLGGGEQCKLDRYVNSNGLDPAAFPSAINNGVPFTRINQAYGTLELNYHVSRAITLSSTTGYYHLKEDSQVNAAGTTFAGTPIGAINHYKDENFSQELRANSDFAGPLNFTLGALYQHDKIHDNVLIIGNSTFPLPPTLVNDIEPLITKTYSVFGQARWRIVQGLELAAGARYTDEKRTEAPFSLLTNMPVPVQNPSVHSKKAAPEVTLTYKPNADLTFFAAYKTGYKSGGFTIATPPQPGVDNSFHDEHVHGFEGGMKARLLDHQLFLNISPYWYKYDGLQVGVIGAPVNGLPTNPTLNAASAKVYGVDIDGSYHPAAIEGLDLNAAIQWNHARYIDFKNAQCFGGQTIAQGCNQQLNPATGLYTAQDLSGTPLTRAPRWQLSAGFDYTLPVGGGYRLTFTNSNSYSSRYLRVLATNYPGDAQFQKAYAKVDLGLTLHSPNDVWELAVLGKNVTDKIVSSHCEIGGVKTGALFAIPRGGATVSPLGIDQENCFPDAGREVWLRLTVRPLN